MTNEQTVLLSLIRFAIQGEKNEMPECDESLFLSLCNTHGVVQIVFAAVQRLSDEYGEKPLQIESVISLYAQAQNGKVLMEQKRKASVAFLKELAMPCVVLKGLDYCRFWPDCDWREFDDLDIWLQGDYKKGNQRAKDIGANVHDEGYYKHSKILWKGVTVENHLFLTMFDNTKGGKVLENALQQLATNTTANDSQFWLSPSNEFTALFMLVHAHQHFFFEGMPLKLVLDWYFFIQKEANDVDWSQVLPVMDKAGIRRFYDIMTAFCVRYLNLKTSVSFSADDSLLECFFNEVFSAEEEAENKIKQLLRRFKRMWLFRCFLGTNIIVRIKNTFVFNYLHKTPTLD